MPKDADAFAVCWLLKLNHPCQGPSCCRAEACKKRQNCYSLRLLLASLPPPMLQIKIQLHSWGLCGDARLGSCAGGCSL
jgi:hypothetical protein